ncbi:MAG: RluA family pseudouridine synthase [Gammaproteobacteria bacterium]|jgi:23S rRNA pseudouridine955/2504/2580 synthase
MKKINQSAIQYIEVNDEHIDRRIDNFLLNKLKGLPKSRLYLLLRKGEIRVNKKRIKPSYRLQMGDIIRIAPLYLSPKTKPAKPNKELLEKLAKRILYEDADLLIINKPVGIAVHGGSGIRLGLIELLRIMRPKEPYLELVHRLDRNTSGCLVIAKKPSVLRKLHNLLRENKMQKIYIALTLGHWRKKINKVDIALRKNVLSSGERVIRASDQGKAAFTEFKVVKDFSVASLVEVKLHTGRTHQIRVHAQISGHPIAGDDKYGDRAFNRIMRDKGLRRMFLHAEKIAFTSTSGKRISITAPLDNELSDVLKQL